MVITDNAYHTLERALCDIWTAALRTDVQAYDNFFNLGGDSMKVIDVVIAARKRGIELRSSAVFRYPTPARLAESLTMRGGDAALSAPAALFASQAPGVVELDCSGCHHLSLAVTGDAPEPLFFLHSHNLREAELNAMHVWSLERPIYALSVGGARCELPFSGTIARIARAYIEDLRKVQPAGPYRLIGAGTGAVLALEMAQQLQNREGQVALLVLIKPPVIGNAEGQYLASMDEALRRQLALMSGRFGLRGHEEGQEILDRIRRDGWYDGEIMAEDLPRLQTRGGGIRFCPGHLHSPQVRRPRGSTAGRAGCRYQRGGAGFIVDRVSNAPVRLWSGFPASDTRRLSYGRDPSPGIDTIMIVTNLPNGLAVHGLNHNETAYLYKEIFEEQVYTPSALPALPHHPVVIDVGANIGMFALFATRRWPDAVIYAFEPAPRSFEALGRNVGHLPGVTILNLALGAAQQTRMLTFYPGYSMMSGFDASPTDDRALVRAYIENVAAGLEDRVRSEVLLAEADELLEGRFDDVETITCTVRSLGDVALEMGITHVDLLKIDVEGFELEVLRGISERLWGGIKNISVEVEDEHGELAETMHLLGSRGMRASAIQTWDYRGTNVHTVFATRVDQG